MANPIGAVVASFALCPKLGGRRAASISWNNLALEPSLFLGGDSLLSQINQLGGAENAARAPAGLRVLHIVSSRKGPVSSGSRSEAPVLRSDAPRRDGTKVLIVTEGVCIAVAAASYSTSVFRDRRNSLVSSTSASENRVLPKIDDLSTWYGPALWAALFINAILRTVQRQASAKTTRQVWEERSINDFTLDQRVGKLEDDLKSVGAIARMLSRHLEKLGVRFRLTRRTLRDPIQQTVLLTQKTSDAVSALAVREDMLEKELKETQQVLVAMQAQQVKQLELLVTGMARTVKSQKDLEGRILKELSSRLMETTVSSSDVGSGVPTSTKTVGAPSESRAQTRMQELGGLWRGLVSKEDTNTKSANLSKKRVAASEVGKVKVKNEFPSKNQNVHAVLLPDAEMPQKKKMDYNPDTSFAKEDFWATATTTTRAPADVLTSTETGMPSDGQPNSDHHKSNTSSGKLDSFFSSRKGSNPSNQDLVNLQSRDFHNPGMS